MSLFDDHQFLTVTRVRGVEVSTGIISEQMEVDAGGSLDFSQEVGFVVIIHNDMDVPFPKQRAPPVYLDQMKALLKRHPQSLTAPQILDWPLKGPTVSTTLMPTLQTTEPHG